MKTDVTVCSCFQGGKGEGAKVSSLRMKLENDLSTLVSHGQARRGKIVDEGTVLFLSKANSHVHI